MCNSVRWSVEGELCFLEVLEVMRCALRCISEGELCLEVPEVMRGVLLCMVEAVENRLCC